MNATLSKLVSLGASKLGLTARPAVVRPAAGPRLDRVTVVPESLHLSAVSGLRSNGSALAESQVLGLIRERRALLWRIEPSGRVHWLFFDPTVGRPLVAIVGADDSTVIGVQPPRKSNRLTTLLFHVVKRLAKAPEPVSTNLDDSVLDPKKSIVLLASIPEAPEGLLDGVTVWAKWCVSRGKIPDGASFRDVAAHAAGKMEVGRVPVSQVVVIASKSGRPLLSQVSSSDLLQR